MSLRTKLLAAVVGLPGAVLLLALAVLIWSESSTPPSAIDRLVHLAGAGNADALGPGLLEQLRAGHFKRAWVIREAGTDPDTHPAEVWTAEAFYGGRTVAPDVVDDDLRRVLVRRMREAATRSPPFVLRSGYLAVGVRQAREANQRGTGIVVDLVPPGSAATAVYWVMVGGMALMMVLSSWLITRLVIRPLARLSAAADRIAAGDYAPAPAEEEAHDEVGRTMQALHRMSREIGEYQGHLEDRVLTALGRIKKAEQHLVIAQRLAATGKLASGLAHEINNPLGGMKNAVRALARGDLDAERTRLYLDLIADGLGRVEQTVKKFLTFTPRNVEPRPTDLAEVVEKSVALAMHRITKKRIEVETDLPEGGRSIVFGDPHELQQVALNLVLNAADAVAEDGTGRIRVSVGRSGDEIVLEVRDNGSGMGPEDQDRCFDMFFTTKPVGEGSGMGLAVVHNIVTNHGGRIELTSAPGAGATFQVFLPAEASAPRGAPAEPLAATRDAPVRDGA
jgi:signal transduction histidine kinase